MKGNYKESSKVNIIKLKVSDYIFRFEKTELSNAILEYNFDKSKDTIYTNGKNTKEIYNDLINFTIHADDKNGMTYTFSFVVKMSMSELNKLSDKPNNINNYIIAGETTWDNPYDKNYSQLICTFEQKMHYDNPNFYAAKIEENKFSFKISIPEECIFIWFNIEFI